MTWNFYSRDITTLIRDFNKKVKIFGYWVSIAYMSCLFFQYSALKLDLKEKDAGMNVKVINGAVY